VCAPAAAAGRHYGYHGPMLILEWVLVLLLAAVVLTNLAERLAVPYPSVLAVAGAGVAFLPFGPQIRIEPELALALFVAPALLDAAFDTSPRGLRDNAIPVASMAVDFFEQEQVIVELVIVE
jgi:NhaP-type Na+/H+ or K+/H+ antiporter